MDTENAMNNAYKIELRKLEYSSGKLNKELRITEISIPCHIQYGLFKFSMPINESITR
jgi:hypothetical protein